MADSRGSCIEPHNPALDTDDDDTLYHFGLSRSTVDLPKEFGDVKYVLTGGSAARCAAFASIFSSETGLASSENLSKSDRYVIYKTGPVLFINHGMGAPSLSIMIVETFKLLHYAGASGVTFFRLGTSGGIGVSPGTVVVTSAPINGELREEHVQYIAGEKVLREARLDPALQTELLSLGQEMQLSVVSGKTLSADDFYEGQMRTNGYFCTYTSEQKLSFLTTLYDLGVRNIEMESLAFASFTARAGVKAAVVCVTLLDRMNGDKVDVPPADYHEFEWRPYKLVAEYIRKQIGI